MELPDVPLFRGLTADEAEAAVTALRMRRRAFAKGEILLEAGQRAPALGVVLAGRVHMEHLDVWGSKTLLGQAGPGDLFAETYACLPDEPLRVSVVAAENGEALFLETGQLLQCGCEPWRWKLTQNLLRIAARKNLGLAQRSLYTAPKTIRGRITAYFSVLARQNGSLRFTLPFDRQQLADHLGVDRSALSSTLSAMQRDGLLTLFEALTDAMESDACYYADATFGTKTYPLVLSSALHYAEKILDDTEVCGIYYRELTRESGQVKNARQYDISTLFTLDGIVDMAADAELTDKKAFIKLMLHPDREV